MNTFFLDLTENRVPVDIQGGFNYISNITIRDQGLEAAQKELIEKQKTSSVGQEDISIFILDKDKNSLMSNRSNTVDTESFYESVDLLSEGPIEGLCDQEGNTVNYLKLDENISAASSSLAYGVYYNDIAVKDKKTNLLNLTAANFEISLGDEINNSLCDSSSVYTYDSRIYDLDFDPDVPGAISTVRLYYQSFDDSENATITQKAYINLKKSARNFSHYIKNKYATHATVNIKFDPLYTIEGDGDVVSNLASFVISVSNLTKQTAKYFIFSINIVAKTTPIIVPIQIKFQKASDLSSNSQEYLINVYSVLKRINSSEQTNSARIIYVDSIIERSNYAFSYPYSALCKNTVSAKHFSEIPVRSFDCKLLKINVPNNYDSDVKEYFGDWDGNFSKVLKWTDNPAWIFYDLCINSRYGLAKTSLSSIDLNKWQLYKISKFCDELVITNANTKYKEDNFLFDNSLSVNQENYNTITFVSSEDISKIKAKYPEKSILYLYNLKNNYGENINLNFKKIILSVTKVNNIVKIKLCNDFSVRKFIESDASGRFYNLLKSYISKNPSILNTEDNAKNYAISYIKGDFDIQNNNTSYEQVSKFFLNQKILDSSLNIASGKCVAKHPEYADFLEPRFSANLYINNTTEGLKILSDLCSVFRGIFYIKNGLLNLTTDIKKLTSYVFTNSNVKDGIFNYTSSNLESSFSVAKVSYLDKYDNFKDKIVYVEDSELIRKYGLIEKEILGFGITSKFQAERIGKWFISTGKLESQTVSFRSGIESNLIKIGDIIRIADNLKNSNVLFGKVTALNFQNNYIYIDREMKSDVLGKKIKLLSIVNDETIESSFTIFEVDNTNLRLTILPYDFLSWNLKNKTSTSDNYRTLSSDGLSAEAWNKKAFSKQSYIQDCQVSFKAKTPNDIMVIGFSSKNDIKNDYTDIEYGFYINSGNLFGIFDSYDLNTPFNFNKTIKNTDLLSIVYDGVNISFYLNNNLLKGDISRSVSNPLYVSAAFKSQFAAINEITFSKYPLPIYDSFSNLRSDVNFAIYLNENEQDEDLYRVIGITENSTNEYSISALKYNEEKFDIIDKNEYIDTNQYNKKQIIFSTEEYISPAFSDAIISNNIKKYNLSYIQAINSNYDYSFPIEREVFNQNFNFNSYISIDIDFNNLFKILENNEKIYGLFCSIIKDGKVLKFKKTKNETDKVSIFLGENYTIANADPVIFDIDIYAFDSSLKLINV